MESSAPTGLSPVGLCMIGWAGPDIKKSSIPFMVYSTYLLTDANTAKDLYLLMASNQD